MSIDADRGDSALDSDDYYSQNISARCTVPTRKSMMTMRSYLMAAITIRTSELLQAWQKCQCVPKRLGNTQRAVC
ncbi:hypothetical protein CY34DRAFT_808705 [Suillus luteus UH-Slu-Lm8-n1]|uniref:Uncharacterized protein n=1 Tax=Suillus luteus UH-Slu-Lm8-n1 TaxID=930992 RepID=A0A0D0ALV4_9AGAM|nr:hypothetical protein CY34DRAFT_808705 [Suillus luteus UH-Slu-Lm8-n1]